MLDRYAPLVRHLALLILMAVLTWAGTELVPSLQDQGGAAAIIAALLTAALAYFTPLTRQYGVGSE